LCYSLFSFLQVNFFFSASSLHNRGVSLFFLFCPTTLMAFHIVQRLDDGRLPPCHHQLLLYSFISLRVKGYLSPLKAFEAAAVAAAGQNGKELPRERISIYRAGQISNRPQLQVVSLPSTQPNTVITITPTFYPF
jgi:hypothetical protein